MPESSSGRRTPHRAVRAHLLATPVARRPGSTLSVYLLLQAVVLWQLAALARTNPAQVRPTILSMTVASIVNAVLTWHSIFPVPAVFGAVVTAFLVAAIIAAGSDATPLATR